VPKNDFLDFQETPNLCSHPSLLWHYWYSIP
jgi:hypothetical protein